jgi:myo-inositol 2-dehydrogenase/D-chiro-inositol 1-dehydrogenase
VATVRVGFLGAGFVAEVHAEAFRHVAGAEVVAVFSQSAARAEAFARRHGIPRWTTDWRSIVSAKDVDLVVVMLPNHLHAEVAVAAAEERKHVIVEKPLCVTLEEADRMIAACERAGVMLAYAEELCFAPKYERLRALAEQGAFGRVYHLRQSEKHSGPHADWFWDVRRAGGGVLMDMGCHAFGWFRWMLGPRFQPTEVLCRLDRHVHRDRTEGEDHSLALVAFRDPEGNVVTAQAEDSWAKLGGMDDRAEVYGTEGVAYADLFQGSAALVYSERGYDYALEKAGSTRGWSFALAEEVYQQGYPHEMQHFVDAVRRGEPPRVSGRDGRAVLELIYAAYLSAGRGAAVRLPLDPAEVRGVRLPVQLWRPEAGRG